MVLDFSHDVDAGHVWKPVFDDREINVAASLNPFDRNPASPRRDDSIGVGKAVGIPIEQIGIVVNDQYLRMSRVCMAGGHTSLPSFRRANTVTGREKDQVFAWEMLFFALL